ncbi:hypothetical protein M406DRAFT_354900 [Cryphonectria parasitica EP155]|uniref:Uncharacterized protein n=1 Tax=Cryphonectria parasitica (strain ATCC 38755 / EP155) TaxID=660469 RepID=A0A9P5CSC8_CRYP1|nr:uncharacterized protein M406DRAFT_354900 [Cryphonectria parasitica EP155]KAF3768452.1 hypothetical protein M406DRAFT_354900 [Cryphonectria parasitica EP155]
MPKTMTDSDILQKYQILAKRDFLTVYMPNNAIPESTISALCNTASNKDCLVLDSDAADYQSWYHASGLGSKIVSPESIDHVISVDRPTASPPSYDELALSPRTSFRKRPRSNPEDDRLPTDKLETLVGRLNNLISEAERKDALLAQRITQVDRRLDQLAEAEATCVDRQMDELKQFIEERLEEAQARINC